MRTRKYFFIFTAVFVYLLFGPKSAHAADKIFFIHQDHLSSTSIVTDQNGRTTSKETYFPYGSTRTESGNLHTERGYTSQVSDAYQTGLYYYNARYYNPLLAKFTQADQALDSLNRYSYVTNNPINYSDPTGNHHTRSRISRRRRPGDPARNYNNQPDEEIELNNLFSDADNATYSSLFSELAQPTFQSLPALQSFSSIAQYAPTYLWLDAFHFMGHAPNAGLNIYQVGQFSQVISEIAQGSTQEGGLIIQLSKSTSSSGGQIQNTYFLISERAGEQWTTLMTGDGKIITAYKTGMTGGKYKAGEAARFLRNLYKAGGQNVTNIPSAIRDNWIDKTPTAWELLKWSLTYKAQSLLKPLSNLKAPGMTDFFLVPAGAFNCDVMPTPLCEMTGQAGGIDL